MHARSRSYDSFNFMLAPEHDKFMKLTVFSKNDFYYICKKLWRVRIKNSKDIGK